MILPYLDRSRKDPQGKKTWSQQITKASMEPYALSFI